MNYNAKGKKHDTEEDTMITKNPKSSNEVDKLQIIYTEITNSYYIFSEFLTTWYFCNCIRL